MTEDESRSDRLRRRRRDAQEAGGSQESKPVKQDEPDEAEEPDGTSVKDEFEPRYLYLPEETNARMDKAHKRLQFELDEFLDYDVEKSRDTFRLIVEEGLDAVREMDAEEIADKVDEKRERTRSKDE